jgi:hypothetical protein
VWSGRPSRGVVLEVADLGVEFLPGGADGDDLGVGTFREGGGEMDELTGKVLVDEQNRGDAGSGRRHGIEP